MIGKIINPKDLSSEKTDEKEKYLIFDSFRLLANDLFTANKMATLFSKILVNANKGPKT